MKFIKKGIAVLLVFILLMSVLPGIILASDNISVTVDGNPIVFTDQQPVIIEGRTLVPIRDVFEYMGFGIEWLPTVRRAVLTRENLLIVIEVDNDVFAINGRHYHLDVPAQLIEGRVMVPLRAVLENVGYNLDWDDNTNTVVITTGADTIVIPEGVNAVRFPFDVVEQNAAAFQNILNNAAQQAINRDRTPVEPTEWRFLWLAYTNIQVEGNSNTFTLGNAERERLQVVADEFQQTVESAVPYISIHNSVMFMEDLLIIPREPHTMIGNSFAISRQLIQDDLDRLNVLGNYDIVLTVTPEGGVFFTGGFAATSIQFGFGYGGLSLGVRPIRADGMIWETRVAIHEWLHMLEGVYRNNFLPGVRFPAVHGYLNQPQYADYGTWGYDARTGNWPYYQQILQGRLLFQGREEIGMFPQMWQLTPRLIEANRRAHVGTYAIRTIDGHYLFRDGMNIGAGEFIYGDERFIWVIRSSGTGTANVFRISTIYNTNLSLDVVNADSSVGNTVELREGPHATSWRFRATNDAVPTYHIHTAAAHNLVLGVSAAGIVELFQTGDGANLRWMFIPVE